jgi:hypothetical protein
MDGSTLFEFRDRPAPNETRPLIVDSFAGGGGASTGIENALGRSPDIAINHNEAAGARAAVQLGLKDYEVLPDEAPCSGCGAPTSGKCWTDCGMSLCGAPLCGSCRHVDEKFGWRHEPRPADDSKERTSQ